MSWYFYSVVIAGLSVIIFGIFYIFPLLFRRMTAMKKTETSNEKAIGENTEPFKRCPSCGKAMENDTFEGIIVDRCVSHGIWFDNEELHSIAHLVKNGGSLDPFFRGFSVEEL